MGVAETGDAGVEDVREPGLDHRVAERRPDAGLAQGSVVLAQGLEDHDVGLAEGGQDVLGRLHPPGADVVGEEGRRRKRFGQEQLEQRGDAARLTVAECGDRGHAAGRLPRVAERLHLLAVDLPEPPLGPGRHLLAPGPSLALAVDDRVSLVQDLERHRLADGLRERDLELIAGALAARPPDRLTSSS